MYMYKRVCENRGRKVWKRCPRFSSWCVHFDICCPSKTDACFFSYMAPVSNGIFLYLSIRHFQENAKLNFNVKVTQQYLTMAVLSSGISCFNYSHMPIRWKDTNLGWWKPKRLKTVSLTWKFPKTFETFLGNNKHNSTQYVQLIRWLLIHSN